MPIINKVKVEIIYVWNKFSKSKYVQCPQAQMICVYKKQTKVLMINKLKFYMINKLKVWLFNLNIALYMISYSSNIWLVYGFMLVLKVYLMQNTDYPWTTK